MLYHLITRNPHKDITLHVSINNPAMVSTQFSCVVCKSPERRQSAAALQSLWLQGRRVHRRLLRGLPRSELDPVEERVPPPAPPLVKTAAITGLSPSSAGGYRQQPKTGDWTAGWTRQMPRPGTPGICARFRPPTCRLQRLQTTIRD